ncbi:MAG TPA: shikimate dehydrogenase, partial [Chloroflexota bacterium]|nr:shikimate dehydrogenase [Chloroflexota bacterium]
FQQAAFDAVGLDVHYHLWETPPEQLADIVSRLRQPDYLGANVTIPHKQAIVRFLDEIDSVARLIGAVNTIVREEGRLLGYNTDVEGFVRALEHDGGVTIAGRRIVVLGAGGAARAVVAAVLLGDPADLALCARRPEQAKALLADLTRAGLANTEDQSQVLPLDATSQSCKQAVQVADVVVNTTPVGMLHHATEGMLPIPADWLGVGQLVYDLIYNPAETPLLRAAKDRGARALNGLPMLVYQGASAFERWTGRAAPLKIMTKRAREALGG